VNEPGVHCSNLSNEVRSRLEPPDHGLALQELHLADVKLVLALALTEGRALAMMSTMSVAFMRLSIAGPSSRASCATEVS
jgi:hypothetical protein